MNDDVRKYIYMPLVLLAVGLVVWIGFLSLTACGFSLACIKSEVPVDRTPVPTFIPATMPAMDRNSKPAATSDNCRVAAADLIGAWVSANSPEIDTFQFTDTDGRTCEGTYAEIAPLFSEPNFWYSGSRSCIYCHSAELTTSAAQLDLTSYAGIQSGSRRADAESKGTDILGGGKWETSLLYQFLSAAKADVPGHTAAMSTGYFVFAGKPVAP